MAEVIGTGEGPGVPGVRGESMDFNGVLGVTVADGHAGVAGVSDEGVSNGVFGKSKNATGVIGFSTADGHAGVAGANDDGNGAGVFGRSARGAGVHGVSAGLNGVLGVTTAIEHAGVAGVHESGGVGVVGRSTGGRGVQGVSTSEHGVFGQSTTGAGVVGVSEDFRGVQGISTREHGVLGESTQGAGVVGVSANHVGVIGRGGRLAGLFEGDVEVTGDVRLANADCAEDFDVASGESIEPGTVVVLGTSTGVLRQSWRAYDKRVAGVVSGAGGFKPGIVLDRRNGQANRVPLALLGKVNCKVDASHGPIEVGDLLTTSDRPGHAMKASDPLKSFGSIIGKALRPLQKGQGSIPILISLQ